MATWVPGTSSEIAQQWRDDYTYAALDVDIENPPVERGTDVWLHSEATGKLGILAYAKIQQAEADTNPLTATAAGLERIRIAKGMVYIGAGSSSGRVRPTISGTRTIEDETKLTANDVRYKVVGHHSALQDGDEVAVESIDKGKHTNLEGGAEIEFDDPPPGVSALAAVSYTLPITGGTDAEDPERLRERIKNEERYTPGGENPGHLRQLVFDNFPGVQNAFVYPGLGGSGTEKLAILKAIDPGNNDFSREVDDVTKKRVENLVQAELNRNGVHVVQSVADEEVDVSLTVDIPDSSLAGGDGTGWLDEAPWPPLSGSDTKVTVTTVTSSKRIVIDASTSTEPVDNLTSVAVWLPGDQSFHTRLIVDHTGSAGAWDITLDQPLLDSDDNVVEVGAYVSPAAANMEEYGKTWREIMGTLGPGENTAHDYRIPRSQRIPLMEDGPQSELNGRLTTALLQAHDEIDTVNYSYRSKTAPTVPGDFNPHEAPNVFVLDNFGIYPE